ncbi:type VII secretion-associated serine protease mycosin [Rhodococcus kronopolitis]|uniref:Type VII secretion-associated serine protease mycosin n=1 Tax=Rhodococcus kronopolitis TaxID=1460226 RepID=A0ABV9FTZ5_9NOCA
MLGPGTATAGLIGSGIAAAVLPPSVDPSRLPPNVPPVPLATELRDPCTETSPVSDPAPVPAPQRTLDLESVWPLTTGRGQLVAVVDTGVARHQRLPGLVAGGDYVSAGDGTEDCDAHGTLVAGIIAAARDDSTGFAGVAPDARILTIRQSSNIYREVRGGRSAEGRNARGAGDVGTLARAIRRAADLGASVVNISEVACLPAGTDDGGTLGAAVDYASRVKDVVLVAAAGNLDSDSCRNSNPPPNPAEPHANPWDSVVTVATPAWYDDQVLTVGSVDPDGRSSPFTVPGPWVDVAAPGTGITSLDPRRTRASDVTDGRNGGTVQGTSFAAPYVAGTVALVRARHPQLTARQVMDRIEATAHRPADGWNPYVGHGVVDPLAAVTAETASAPIGPDPSSRELAITGAVAPQDPRPRTTALFGAIAVGSALGVGLLASFPLRRIRQRAGSDTATG